MSFEKVRKLAFFFCAVHPHLLLFCPQMKLKFEKKDTPQCSIRSKDLINWINKEVI
jgi:hypothetical protein